MNKLFEWTQELEICDKVDSQHKRLVNLINELYDAFTKAKANEIISEILQQLYDYTIYHFSTEEKMLEEANYPLLEDHIKEHQNFIVKINEFITRFKKNDFMLSYDVMLFLRDWLLNHIMVSDHKYQSYCK